MCSTWQDFGPGVRECRKINCVCDERVAVVVKKLNEKDEFTATYECVEEYCGYKVVAYGEHCRAYVTILDNMKEYFFFIPLKNVNVMKKHKSYWNELLRVAVLQIPQRNVLLI